MIALLVSLLLSLTLLPVLCSLALKAGNEEPTFLVRWAKRVYLPVLRWALCHRRWLADVPGISVLMSQPIQERVDALISVVKTEIAIKPFGDDLDVLKTRAEQIEAIMRTVRGGEDVKVEQIAGHPYVTVDIDRHKIARH